MRQEFTKRTKIAAWNRCGGKCEECGSELKAQMMLKSNGSSIQSLTTFR